jgi:CubicO group peptidase (beta-lactamase class C family)
MSKATAATLQTQVQKVIDELVESGTESGLQVAAYRRGEQVVDAVAGVADPATGRPFSSDTPAYCYSVVKGAAPTLIHQLVERGKFGYDTPVASLWPEFAANRKDTVTVRQVLNHTAGVPGIPLTTTIEDLCEWDKMCRAIAGEKLWWEPGTKIGYHAYTFDYITGELIRRVTGKPISQVLREEISGPLGVEKELYFGMPRSEQGRLAVQEDAPLPPNFQMPEMPPDLPMFKAAPMSLMPNAAFGNRPDTVAADIPAGGKSSARAIARMYAAIVGTVDGVRLLPPARLREATSSPFTGDDQVFGMPTTWALGYAAGVPGVEPKDPPTSFGVGGVVGSFAGFDMATGITFAVTKNRLTQDFNAASEIARARDRIRRMKLTVVCNLTLDGVMQAPAARDEDTRGGFTRGGWAVPYQDQVMGAEMGKSMARGGGLLLGRRTYEHFYKVWPKRKNNPYTEVLNNAQKYAAVDELHAAQRRRRGCGAKAQKAAWQGSGDPRQRRPGRLVDAAWAYRQLLALHLSGRGRIRTPAFLQGRLREAKAGPQRADDQGSLDRDLRAGLKAGFSLRLPPGGSAG